MVIGFRGKLPVNSKIVVGNKNLVQILHFAFHDYDISYEHDDGNKTR